MWKTNIKRKLENVKQRIHICNLLKLSSFFELGIKKKIVCKAMTCISWKFLEKFYLSATPHWRTPRGSPTSTGGPTKNSGLSWLGYKELRIIPCSGLRSWAYSITIIPLWKIEGSFSVSAAGISAATAHVWIIKFVLVWSRINLQIY